MADSNTTRRQPVRWQEGIDRKTLSGFALTARQNCRPEWGADGSNCEPFMQARIKAMKDSKAESNTTQLQAELDRQNARNNKLQELLLKMERLWPTMNREPSVP